MSTYTKLTKNPVTGEFEQAIWMDDHFAHHHYGVKFSNGLIYDPESVHLETKDMPVDKVTAHGAVESDCDCAEREMTEGEKDIAKGLEDFLNIDYLDDEIVICSAVLNQDGIPIRGHRHNDCLATIKKMGGDRWPHSASLSEGFITSRNRFVNRSEGYEIQIEAGIKSVLEKTHPDDVYRGKELYSEDLY